MRHVRDPSAQATDPPEDLVESRRPRRPRLLGAAALGLIAVTIAGQTARAREDESPVQLRQFIDQQIGGIGKFVVPATDAALPLPRNPDGTVNPRYKTTEEKRFLGKMLFHDPVRTVRIDTAYGGELSTARSGSCGSCHLGQAATKAGQVFNFNVGGEGLGYTDADGKFIVRRRTRSDLPILRQSPLFPGDSLVDALPTLTDVYHVPEPPPGHIEIATPARGRKLPLPDALLATGRLDAVDSVARQSPSVIGFAFNNRLLLGGFAGEPDSAPGGLNPFNDPAQENLTLLLLDAHRMLSAQGAELKKYPAFVKLFQDAFPEEAAAARTAKDMSLLVNDETVLRATATYLRTTVTRNTPWDRFIAGDNSALTPAQRRGARLFFTPAAGGSGGAGCFSCHSGPMFNKQSNDPDIGGVGHFVEENFVNVGIGDHPLQALARAARNDPNFHDEGRKEITFKDEDAFEFRVTTLRQLKDARTFFHNGSFTKVRDVVQYFNAGVPQDAAAGAAATLSRRFTHPRGAGWPRGLGLNVRQVDDLTDFIENALYDPAFVHDDPTSTTRAFQPTERDLTYSKHRPDLAALGAVDGRMISGLPADNNDALSRRDMGLEFLDVTAQLSIARAQSLRDGRETRGDHGGRHRDTYRFTNVSSSVVDTHLLVIVQGLERGVRLANASGATRAGDPYLRVHLPEGVLRSGESTVQTLEFSGRRDEGRARYTLKVLSGQGNP
jgi:cytochrome c peroxidase